LQNPYQPELPISARPVGLYRSTVDTACNTYVDMYCSLYHIFHLDDSWLTIFFHLAIWYSIYELWSWYELFFSLYIFIQAAYEIDLFYVAHLFIIKIFQLYLWTSITTSHDSVEYWKASSWDRRDIIKGLH
jgi:hypothetical protein